MDNLLAAGRNLSSDVYAQSGARLIMCCFTMGEVAGIAACMSIEQNITPRQIDRKELQKELIRNNINLGQAFRNIPGVTDTTKAFYDDYLNPEFKKDGTIVENSANEFTRK